MSFVGERFWTALLFALPAGGVGAGEAEDVAPGREGTVAGLAELVRVMPGVIIGGRGTDTEAPFGRPRPAPENAGRAIEGVDGLLVSEGAELGGPGTEFSFPGRRD